MSTDNHRKPNIILQRLLQALLDVGVPDRGKVSKVAEITGYSNGQVSALLSGKEPLNDRFKRAVCAAYSISESYIDSGKGPHYLKTEGSKEDKGKTEEPLAHYRSEKFHEVGVYALAGAGPARDLVEHEPIEMIVIPKSFWRPSIAAIKVRGRSMEPLILDGAYLGIDREDKWIISGEIYAVWIPYEGAVIKRLYIDPERITLRSDNKDFPEFSILVKEASEGMILGRVKWVLQQF